MSVIIRLQNLPWSANALDIRNFFRGLSIPEGGVHIVGGELGDAFIAFSTDEDARQAMMLNGGKLKEIQVNLLLSSRSEMHKVIEAARQNVPILSLTAAMPAAPTPPAPAPLPIVQPAPVVQPVINAFSAALGSNTLSSFGIPGLGNPQEIPQPAVIEVPTIERVSPSTVQQSIELEKEDDKQDLNRKGKDRRRSKSRSRSRDRDRKDRKRDRRDRSRSRDRRRRDRSRSRDRRDRKRRSRSRERSPSRRSRDRRNPDRVDNSQERGVDSPPVVSAPHQLPAFGAAKTTNMPMPAQHPPLLPNGPNGQMPQEPTQNRFTDPVMNDALSKLQELGKKRNPNAFQGDQNGIGTRFQNPPRGGGAPRGGSNYRRDGRPSRFDTEPQRDCCVVIRNAPNHTSYGDVRRFFPFMIDKHGIKMINDNMGRRTGTIFVRFCEARSKHLVLQRRINELKDEPVLVEDLDDESYDAAVDSFMPYREENDMEDSHHGTPDVEEKQPAYSVLKLSDLPNFVKEQDIIKAFSDFSLLSIMLNDCRLTKSKVAYVQFVKAEDARLAFDKRESYVFGRRQATIEPVSIDEYEKEKTIQVDKPGVEPLIEIPDEPIQEVQPPRDPRQRRQPPDVGPPQTQGPPFFPQSFGQQPGLLPPFPGPQFGGFQPGVGGDPRNASVNPRGPPWPNRSKFPNEIVADNKKIALNDIEDEPLDCVLMKGLPCEATDRTIVTFLSDTGAVPARIHLMLDSCGVPSGDCFCEFRSPQEARRAATKHGQDLDGHRVTVDLVTRTVVEEALEGPKRQEIRDEPLINSLPQPLFPLDPPQIGFGAPRSTFRGRGGFDRGSFDRGGFDRGGFDRGFERSFDRGFERGSIGRGFDSRTSYRGRGAWNERGGVRGSGRGRGFSRGRGGFDGGREREREEEPDPGLEGFGAPGCVVSMENVPFRATVDDLLQFFSEFELTQDDVIRRYNERGMPTGDARVAFRTPFDAQRAVKTRHMDTILDRRINLCIL